MESRPPGKHSAPSPRMQALLQQLAQEDANLPDPTTLSPQKGRELTWKSHLRWNLELPEMESVEALVFEGHEGQQVNTRLYVPKQTGPGLIYFIHGGGFAFCNLDTHERQARLLAMQSHCSLLSIDYRLAPENPYPAGLEDCITVFRQLPKLLDEHPALYGPIAVAGDSAGANLALALILNEQAQQRTSPDMALLFYGVYDCDFNTRSYREFEHGPGLTRAKMMRYMDWYASVEQRSDPLVSPGTASDERLARLPPLYLNAAEIDPLCSDTENLVARLRKIGRTDQLQIQPGVVHGFMQMSLRLPAAHQATTNAAQAFRKFAEQYHRKTISRNK